MYPRERWRYLHSGSVKFSPLPQPGIGSSGCINGDGLVDASIPPDQRSAFELPAVLSASTFCILLREFSPLGAYSGWSKKALVGWVLEADDKTGSAHRILPADKPI